MKKTFYILKYKNNKYVQRDDSRGPMSTGGYPCEVDTIEQATKWHTIEEAAKYGSMFSDQFETVVYELEIVYSIVSFVPFPPVWERCNHHCVSDALSTRFNAMHFADCTLFK